MLLLTELCHYTRKRVTIHQTVLPVPACYYWFVRCYYIRTVLQLQTRVINYSTVWEITFTHFLAKPREQTTGEMYHFFR
jgi:hypothetical protein